MRLRMAAAVNIRSGPKLPLAEGMLSLALSSCANYAYTHPDFPGGLPVNQSSADYLTVAVERTDASPNRFTAQIIDNTLSVRSYPGYCWLFYSRQDDGEYLLNPKNGEQYGKVVNSAVVKLGGKPEILFRLRQNNIPQVDAVFMANSGKVCRMTEEPKVTIYYSGELSITAVPLERLQ